MQDITPRRNGNDRFLHTFANFTPIRNVFSWLHSPLIKTLRMGPTERLVLIALAGHTVKEDIDAVSNIVDERVSYQVLADFCGISRRQAMRVVKRLHDENLVRVVPVPGPARAAFKVRPVLVSKNHWTAYRLGILEPGDGLDDAL